MTMLLLKATLLKNQTLNQNPSSNHLKKSKQLFKLHIKIQKQNNDPLTEMDYENLRLNKEIPTDVLILNLSHH